MALEIPVSDVGPDPGDLVPHFEQRTELDGVEYVLRFKWNEREQRWYLDLLDVDEVPIAFGLKLVANWPILRTIVQDGRRPPGEIVIVDTTNEGDPRLGDLGSRVRVIYVPADELPA